MFAKKIQLTDKVAIGPEEKTFIIAEIGQNHQGTSKIARELILKAKEAGADCVKFQKTSLFDKFTDSALSTPYVSENSWGRTYGEHKHYLEFKEEQFVELKKYANDLGMMFSASAMDIKSLDFLLKLELPFIKIGSGDANNILLLEKAAQSGVPLIISTGMQDFEEVKRTYNLVSRFHNNFVLLHCLSSYPAPYNELNLNVLRLYKDHFPDVNLGYSGHELGIHVTTATVAMGAKVIERHITLDKTFKGTDHSCSLEPEEFKQLVDNIRTLEESLGKPVKALQESEKPCYNKLQKTIVFTKDLKAGHKLELEDLNIKVAIPRGIDGSKIYEVVGETLKKDVYADDSLLQRYLQ